VSPVIFELKATIDVLRVTPVVENLDKVVEVISTFTSNINSFIPIEEVKELSFNVFISKDTSDYYNFITSRSLGLSFAVFRIKFYASGIRLFLGRYHYPPPGTPPVGCTAHLREAYLLLLFDLSISFSILTILPIDYPSLS
jgi:hypothetical protein